MLEEESPQAERRAGNEGSDDDQAVVSTSSRASSLVQALPSKSLGRLERSALLSTQLLSAPLQPPPEEGEEADSRQGLG